MSPADLVKSLNGNMSEYAFAVRYYALLLAVTVQAVDDFRGLQDRGVFLGGEVNEGFFSRYRPGRAGYRRPMNFQRESEITELLHFFQDWPLEYLCELTGLAACRIRREIGIRKEKK
jgi:hypothetical protein